MRHPTLLFALLINLIVSTALADCDSFTGEGNAVLALAKLYNNDCLGLDQDSSTIAIEVKDRMPEIDVSELTLRTSADVEQVRIRTGALLDEIAASLAGVSRGPALAPFFEISQAQIAADRSSVLAGDTHPAEPWRVDDLKLLGDRIDIGSRLGQQCGTDNTSLCIASFRQSSELIRHATLVADVLFESNEHIPQLTLAYANLDKQWDYYFGNARSQYIWELKLNSWRYDKQLVKRCTDEKKSTLEGWELKKFCKDRKDVRLSQPPIGQWIFLHPTAAIEYVASDEADNSSTSAIAVVEIIGYNRFANKNGIPKKWPFGGSLIATVSLDNSGDRFGYGAMLHLRNNLSIGVARREFAGQSEWTWLLSVDLGKLVTKISKEAKEKMQFLDL